MHSVLPGCTTGARGEANPASIKHADVHASNCALRATFPIIANYKAPCTHTHWCCVPWLAFIVQPNSRGVPPVRPFLRSSHGCLPREPRDDRAEYVGCLVSAIIAGGPPRTAGWCLLQLACTHAPLTRLACQAHAARPAASCNTVSVALVGGVAAVAASVAFTYAVSAK